LPRITGRKREPPAFVPQSRDYGAAGIDGLSREAERAGANESKPWSFLLFKSLICWCGAERNAEERFLQKAAKEAKICAFELTDEIFVIFVSFCKNLLRAIAE